jgi:hypothetical protein
MLDTLFTESFVRNFRSLGSAVVYLRFGYGFINNDAGSVFAARFAFSPLNSSNLFQTLNLLKGELHRPVLEHYDAPSLNLKAALLHVILLHHRLSDDVDSDLCSRTVLSMSTAFGRRTEAIRPLKARVFTLIRIVMSLIIIINFIIVIYILEFMDDVIITLGFH